MARRASVAMRAALVAASLVMTVAAPPSGAAPLGAPPCDKPGRFVTQPHFLAMSLPRFPDSDYPYDSTITPARRQVWSADYGLGRVFSAAVANQNSVLTTADGGCNWTTVFSLPTVADSDGNSGALLTNIDKVLGVAVSKQPGTHDLYVDVEGQNLHTGDARLLISHSGGSSFTTHQFAGLVSARPVTSPAETGVAYVLGHPSDATQPQLWRTDDAGAHWTMGSVPPGVLWGSAPTTGLYVDPTVRRRVWAYTNDSTGVVFRSDDAGHTWQRVGQVGSHIQMFALWYHGRTPVIATAPSNAQAVAKDPTGTSTGTKNNLPYYLVELSTTGGKTWRELHSPVQGTGGYYEGQLTALAPPTGHGDVTALIDFTPDSKTSAIHALTATGARWRVTGQLPWADPSWLMATSMPVTPGSVGVWWLDCNNASTNWLFRYSTEQ